MAKITKTEFENYNKQFLSIFARMMATSEFKNESKEEQEKLKNFFFLNTFIFENFLGFIR